MNFTTQNCRGVFLFCLPVVYFFLKSQKIITKPRDQIVVPIRSDFFSYKQNKKTVPANQGPRLAGLEPGQFLSYKHPLDGNVVKQKFSFFSSYIF